MQVRPSTRPFAIKLFRVLEKEKEEEQEKQTMEIDSRGIDMEAEDEDDIHREEDEDDDKGKAGEEDGNEAQKMDNRGGQTKRTGNMPCHHFIFASP